MKKAKRTTPKIMHRAGELRKEQTPAEAKLWVYLRAHRADGVGFRRQHACPELVEGPSSRISPTFAPRAGNWLSKWMGVNTSTSRNTTPNAPSTWKLMAARFCVLGMGT
jgi:hypothetical protein